MSTACRTAGVAGLLGSTMPRSMRDSLRREAMLMLELTCEAPAQQAYRWLLLYQKCQTRHVLMTVITEGREQHSQRHSKQHRLTPQGRTAAVLTAGAAGLLHRSALHSDFQAAARSLPGLRGALVLLGGASLAHVAYGQAGHAGHLRWPQPHWSGAYAGSGC